MLSRLLDDTAWRAVLAALFSLSLSLVFGSRAIAWLRARFREPIVGDSATLNALHQPKQSTPTMGGLFVLAAILIATLVFGNLYSLYLLAAAVLVCGLGVLGAVDDLLKVTKRSRGLSVRAKLCGQIAVAVVISLLLYWRHADVPGGLALQLPGAGVLVDLGAWFVPLSAIVIVGSANAVNLTDGLDGLAAGCLVTAISVLAILGFVAGDAKLANLLHIVPIPEAGELTVLAGGTVGALLGFLWFNRYPARVFMGDTGSLPLGGLLGFLAVTLRQELLLVIIGGVFVVEAASVVIQVGMYKWRRRRVFRCAPLHHHFQFQGWPEPTIVVRFWMASALLAVLGLVTLSSRASLERPPLPSTTDGHSVDGVRLRPGGPPRSSPDRQAGS